MATQTKSDDSLQTQASLLERLRDLDDSDSWAHFYAKYESTVRGLARQRGLTEAEAEEVAQEVFKKVAEKIHNFEHISRTGSFRNWLYRLARWRADDKLRERGRISMEAIEDPSSGLTTAIHRIPAPDELEKELEADARRQLIHIGLERLKVRGNPRDIQIFEMLMVQEMSAQQVAKFLGVTVPMVYVARHRVGRLLKAELSKILKRLNRGLEEY